jgi:hypothetical protein
VVSTRRCSTALHLWSASVAVRKLSWTLNWLRTWSSSFLASTITWLESSQCFLLYLNNNVYEYVITSYTRKELWRRIRQFESEIRNIPGIFGRLRLCFSCRAELCIHKNEALFEHLLYGSKKQYCYHITLTSLNFFKNSRTLIHI